VRVGERRVKEGRGGEGNVQSKQNLRITPAMYFYNLL
jgi:hypothetical protein